MRCIRWVQGFLKNARLALSLSRKSSWPGFTIAVDMLKMRRAAQR